MMFNPMQTLHYTFPFPESNAKTIHAEQKPLSIHREIQPEKLKIQHKQKCTIIQLEVEPKEDRRPFTSLKEIVHQFLVIET